MIAGTSPPWDWSTYQIHMPWRTNGEWRPTPEFSNTPAPPVSARGAAGSASDEREEDRQCTGGRRAPRDRGGWDGEKPHWFSEHLSSRSAAGRPRPNISPSRSGTDLPTLPLTRKIPPAIATLLLATVALLAVAPGARAAARPQIKDATVEQAGQDLVLTVRTAKPVALAKLQPRPDVRRAGAAYLCFGFAKQEGDRLGRGRRAADGRGAGEQASSARSAKRGSASAARRRQARRARHRRLRRQAG